MTNTTFRRRALLSSVAMLLVALVALGSATFAWFVSDPTAKADGLAMKTTTSTGLVIDTATEGNSDFTHDEDLNVQTSAGGTSTRGAVISMSPASMTELGAMKTVDANASTGYIGKPGATIGTADTSTYYTETIECKTTDGSADSIKQATITFTDADNPPTIKAAFRVALLDSTGTILATWGGSSGAKRYLGSTLTTYPDSAVTTTRTVVASGTAQSISVSIPANSTATLTLVAYLDGEDDQCFSDQASLADCFSNITLNLSLTALT